MRALNIVVSESCINIGMAMPGQMSGSIMDYLMFSSGQNPGMYIFKRQHTTLLVALDTLVVDVKVSGLHQNHEDFPMM